MHNMCISLACTEQIVVGHASVAKRGRDGRWEMSWTRGKKGHGRYVQQSWPRVVIIIIDLFPGLFPFSHTLSGCKRGHS